MGRLNEAGTFPSFSKIGPAMKHVRNSSQAILTLDFCVILEIHTLSAQAIRALTGLE